MSTAVWYHVAITRSGNDLKIFQDGTQVGSTATGSENYADIAGSLLIGRYADNTTFDFDGWIDEFNFVNGTALYTNTFSPPTVPYGTADPAKSYAYFM